MTAPGTAKTRPVCKHWSGDEGAFCLSVVGVRRYVNGERCPLHTPEQIKTQYGPVTW